MNRQLSNTLALWSARNREYYRDKSSLFWSFVFTPLLVIIIALSFSGGDTEVFVIGLENDTAPSFAEDAEPSNLPGAERRYITWVEYHDHERALKQVQYQQIDLLLDNDQQRYWINDNSAKSTLLIELLESEMHGWQREQITGNPVRYIDWVLPGLLAMNIMFSGLFGVGYVIVRYRKNGVLKRLQAAPIGAWQFLLAQGMSRLIIMMVVSTCLFLLCGWLVDVLVVGNPWLLLLVAFVGILSIIGLALLFASRSASEEFANGLINAVTFPMLLLSEVWFSLDKAPAWLQSVSDFSPLTHIVRAARAVMLEGAGLPEISYELMILLAISIVTISAAAIMFKWHKE